MDKQISRRSFVKQTGRTAGVVGTTFAVARSVVGGSQTPSPSDRLHIAGVGIGGMGAANLRNMESEAIVTLCDVDRKFAAGTIKRYPQATVYTDYRRMLEKQKDIDAVMVATPDHTHAVISMAAIKAGKHVYCQKPLTHTVYEARKLTEAAAEAKVATQMGIQGHSGDGIRKTREWIEAGVIGKVDRVEAWCDLSYYPWGHASWSCNWSKRPAETPPVPGTLNWDLWIGPAPMRPYHRAYHPRTWRSWWDFGSGMMGDRGAHTIDPVFWSLHLDAPLSIDATTCGNTKEVHPLSSIVTYRFAERKGFPPLTLAWYEGTRPPRPLELEDGRRMPREGGAFFKGTKGTIMCGVYGNGACIIPAAKMKEAELPPETIPRVRGSHEMNWVNACKTGDKAGADFSYSGPLAEACCLGNVAKRVDARIEWDPENLRITNIKDANQFIHRTYRKGWEL